MTAVAWGTGGELCTAAEEKQVRPTHHPGAAAAPPTWQALLTAATSVGVGGAPPALRLVTAYSSAPLAGASTPRSA